MFQNPHQVCAYTPSGDVLANYEAYSSALGIRTLSFYRPPISGATFGITSPATQLMAVGSYDGKIRLMSMTSWSPALLLPLAHPREMDAGVMSTTGEIVYYPNSTPHSFPHVFFPPNPNSSQFKDVANFSCTVEICDNPTPAALPQSKAKQQAPIYTSTYFVSKGLKTLPRVIPEIRYIRKEILPNKITRSRSIAPCSQFVKYRTYICNRDPKFLPQMGNNWMGWSADGSLIAAREESYPRCIWIWDSLSAKLVALLVSTLPRKKPVPILTSQFFPRRQPRRCN